jgi:hypothetical protein
MRWIARAAAVFACLVSAGCMTVGPVTGPMRGENGFTYVAGRASQDFAYPPATLHAAVVAAMGDLRIEAVRQTNEAGAIIFTGTTADGRRVSVTLRPNQGISRVSTRIGWFGDEPLSKALLDRIGIRVGSLPPAAIPVEPPSSPSSNPFFSRDAIPDSQMLRDQADAIYKDTPVP